MKVTKHRHACFTVEDTNKTIVVDPGVWTEDLGTPENVVAVVITHEHQDHFDQSMIDALFAHNPDIVVISHDAVTSKLQDDVAHKTVAAGDTITVGPFSLEFFGGRHATIHPDIPVVANLGVMINDKLYYPGDSFTVPKKPVDTLALPVSAPWLKISETMDFLTAVAPRLAFPTHDAILSGTGKELVDRMINGVAKNAGSNYQRLSDPIEL